MARKHVAFAYAEPRSKQSVRKKEVRMVGDSTPNQVAKTHRIYQSFLLQGNFNAPGRFLECPTVGDDTGNSVCPCVDDIGLHRLTAMRERN